MPVHIDHDGVDWQDDYGRLQRQAVVLLVSVVVAAGTGALAITMLPPLVAVLLGIAMPVAALALLGRGRGRAIVLRPDRLWLGAPPHRTEILLDDLEAVRVSLPDSRQSCLVLETREGRFPVGLGAPEAHLRWFAAAIERARHHDARTDTVAGHELFFHREEPEAFQRGPVDEDARRAKRLSEQRRRE